MSLPAGRWPTGPSTVYSSSVDFAWCRFPKLRTLSEQDSDIWSMETTVHVPRLTNGKRARSLSHQWRLPFLFFIFYLTSEDTAWSLSDQWRHCTLFIWPLETLHVLYLLHLTNGDSARSLSSLSDQWRLCTFFIWPIETQHVLYPTNGDTSRSLSDQLKQYTLPTLQAPGASQNQRQAKKFLRDLKHEWLLAFHS